MDPRGGRMRGGDVRLPSG